MFEYLTKYIRKLKTQDFEKFKADFDSTVENDMYDGENMDEFYLAGHLLDYPIDPLTKEIIGKARVPLLYKILTFMCWHNHEDIIDATEDMYKNGVLELVLKRFKKLSKEYDRKYEVISEFEANRGCYRLPYNYDGWEMGGLATQEWEISEEARILMNLHNKYNLESEDSKMLCEILAGNLRERPKDDAKRIKDYKKAIAKERKWRGDDIYTKGPTRDDNVTCYIRPNPKKIACRDCLLRASDEEGGAVIGTCKVFDIQHPKLPEILFQNAECPYYIPESALQSE